TPLTNVTVATFTCANPFATAADFSAEFAWGDGALSSGTDVSISGGSGSFTVVASHTYYVQGAFTTSITVTDAANHSTIFQGTAFVLGAALQGSPKTLSLTEGVWFAGVVASFTDPSLPPGGTPFYGYPYYGYPYYYYGNFQAIIDWGNGMI